MVGYSWLILVGDTNDGWFSTPRGQEDCERLALRALAPGGLLVRLGAARAAAPVGRPPLGAQRRGPPRPACPRQWPCQSKNLLPPADAPKRQGVIPQPAT